MNEDFVQYLERIENIREDIKGLNDDQKAVFAEAKAQGYDTKIMRAILVIRAMDPEKRKEYQALLDTYMVAAGMVIDA